MLIGKRKENNMENKYIPCEVRWKIMNNEIPDLGKFIAIKEDLEVIFFMDNKFRESKIFSFDGRDFYDFKADHQLARTDFGTQKRIIVEKSLTNMIVVEPYLSDLNGNILADVDHFAIMHVQTTGAFDVHLSAYPKKDPCGLRVARIFKFWAVMEDYEKEREIYRVHHNSTTMSMEMRNFTFHNAANGITEYSDEYNNRQKQIVDREEKKEYERLKAKFEHA